MEGCAACGTELMPRLTPRCSGPSAWAAERGVERPLHPLATDRAGADHATVNTTNADKQAQIRVVADCHVPLQAPRTPVVVRLLGCRYHQVPACRQPVLMPQSG
jgi:hypothetical protein